MFPTNEIERIQANPEDYRLLRRSPLSKLSHKQMPFNVHDPVGDEVSAVCLDVETTGLNADSSDLIELGMVAFQYSPKAGSVTRINDIKALFEDPGYPIPENITQITGITNDDVADRVIYDDSIARWFEDDPLVLAHNAQFDRPFFEGRFPEIESKRWVCTMKEIHWAANGYESTKLEYLMLKNGYFYEGHRASVDCLATIELLKEHPDALRRLHFRAQENDVVVYATGAPFDVKDRLKERGYRWNDGKNGNYKAWWCQISEDQLETERQFLSRLYPGGNRKATIERISARERYRR